MLLQRSRLRALQYKQRAQLGFWISADLNDGGLICWGASWVWNPGNDIKSSQNRPHTHIPEGRERGVRCVLHVHCTVQAIPDFVLCVLQAAMQILVVDTQDKWHETDVVCVPDNLSCGLGQVGGAVLDNLGGLACKSVRRWKIRLLRMQNYAQPTPHTHTHTLHTHTHTHTHTHCTHTHTHTQTHAYTHTNTHTYTHTYARTHAQTHIHTQSHSWGRKHKLQQCVSRTGLPWPPEARACLAWVWPLCALPTSNKNSGRTRKTRPSLWHLLRPCFT